MAGDNNLCACYLYFLRLTQDHCSEAECYTPNSLPGPSQSSSTDSTDFMMFFMFMVVGLILYMLRPKSIRDSGNSTKGFVNDSDFDGEPPLPPPAIN